MLFVMTNRVEALKDNNNNTWYISAVEWQVTFVLKQYSVTHYQLVKEAQVVKWHINDRTSNGLDATAPYQSW